MGILRLTGLAVSVSAALVAAPALADTLPVPSDDFPDIQTAINAAMPGDEVLVADGTYSGAGSCELVLPVEITLRSENGAAFTTIDCENAARAITITAHAVVEGFTFINGYTSGEGGAILVDGASPTIRACSFQDNTAESDGTGTPLNFFSGNGGAIAYANGGGGLVDVCTFSGNKAIATAGDPMMYPTGDILSGVGGAILVGSGSRLLITDSQFDGNQAVGPGLIGNGFGGAIGTDLFNSSPANLEIRNSSFEENTAQIAGGGLFLFGAHTVTIEDASFSGNSAQSGGAVGFQTGLELTIRESEFERNFTVAEITFLTPDAQEQIGGGALAGGGGSTLTLEGSTFVENSSLAGRGGAVSTFDEGTATITGCTFTSNEAKLAGGAVVNQEAPALATEEDPTGPSTTTMIECVLASNRTPGLGGGVANLEGSSLTATACGFDENTAESPGAGGVQPSLGNGGAMVCNGVAVLDGCTFSANRAIASGDILAGTGGAVLVGSGADLVVNGCSFNDNEALSAGVIGNGFGGAIATDLLNFAPASIVIQGGDFAGNHASIAGGALFLFGAHVATIENGASFEDNSAQSGGAIAFQTGMNLTIRGAEFRENFTVADITFLFENAQEQIGGGAIGGGGGGSALSVEDALFIGNVSRAGRGGAVGVFGEGNAKLTNCEFRDNAAMLEGGAVVNQEAPALGALGPTAPSTMYLTNCLLACNTSGLEGGGVANLEGGLLIAANCTLAHNLATSAGGGGLASIGQFQPPPPNEVDPPPTPIPSIAALVNCILWGNESAGGPPVHQIEDDGAGTVKYSLVEGGWPGKGNVDANPMFVDDDGEDECNDNDYRLAAGSPAIDAGNNWGVPRDTLDMNADGELRELIPFDLDGLARFNADELDFDPGCGVPVVVDMGAYEYQFDPVAQVLFADADGNGAVDVDDLVEVIGAWGPCEDECCIDDFDLNDDVDVDDLLAVILYWG